MELTTKEAVQVLLDSGMSKYRLAKNLGLAPTSINQYLKGTKMSEATAKVVKAEYNITVTDCFKWSQ